MTQTVREGLDLILAGKVENKDLFNRQVEHHDQRDTITPHMLRLERALGWIADRVDALDKKTEVIIDEAGLR